MYDFLLKQTTSFPQLCLIKIDSKFSLSLCALFLALKTLKTIMPCMKITRGDSRHHTQHDFQGTTALTQAENT